jgi:hypothetical protein
MVKLLKGAMAHGIIRWYNIIFVIIFLASSCKKERGGGGQPPSKNHSTFNISNTKASSDNDGRVEIDITFSGLSDIEYLQVRKSGAGIFSEQISRNQLATSYRYIYNIQNDDPKTFDLAFNVRYIDKTESKSQVVQVTNKKGEVINGGDSTRERLLVKNVTRIARVTGRSISGEGLINPNSTDQVWDVGGTDLGIIWETDPGVYGIFFGDTFGSSFTPNPSNPGPNGGNWRGNVLGFSKNKDLDQGIVFDNMVTGFDGKAKELLIGATAGSTSLIPTAAIRVNGIDYVHCFKVNSWNPNLSTKYSALYKSADNGKNWSRIDAVTFPGDSRFALVGYYKKDGFVYMIGTPTYRNKPAYLARFKETDIEKPENYEYWNGDTKTWIKGNENQASIIIGGSVGELSLIYNSTYKKWIIAYFNAAEYNITMRIADEITGPWGTNFVLATGAQYPQLYGSYFHPLSAKGDFLYFTMSMWMPYNVFLMKVELSDK